ncbi:hypothetical protein TorRG33x02_347460 [Trema orientale]|uniref:Uncharacterized protein n=1 Tax=Trema orientale TaxID=63057 RepID=A0A2P5ALJ8_TREOI|nr:hypothetical protein TorRG33x02_347460 [Trema orientale]
MDAYLLKIKNAVDSLVSIGYFISTEDHIEAIFDGLLDEYDTFVISTSSRLDPYTVEDIESLLLAQEIRIDKHGKAPDPSLINFTTQSHPNPNNNNFRKNNRGGFSQGHQSFINNGGSQSRGFNPNSFSNGQYGRGGYSGRGNFSPRGRGGGRQGWNSNKPQC